MRDLACCHRLTSDHCRSHKLAIGALGDLPTNQPQVPQSLMSTHPTTTPLSRTSLHRHRIKRHETLTGQPFAWANLLGRNDAARVLEQTLERAAGKKLTTLAESKVKLRAVS